MSETFLICGFAPPGHFIAFRRFHPELSKRFKAGDRVIVEIYEPRSVKWEKKFFAIVGTAWANLDYETQQNFSSPDELRKWALIQTGHYTERKGVMRSNKDALNYIAQPRGLDDYVLFSVNGSAIVERRPKSMRRDSMNREEFDKASTDVIAFLAKMLGVTEDELTSAHRDDKLSPALIDGADSDPSLAGEGRRQPAPEGGAVEARRRIAATLDVDQASPGGPQEET